MQVFTNSIDKAVELIKGCEERRKKLASKLAGLAKNFESKEAVEKSLILPVEKATLNETIAGIDSGFVSKSLLSIEIVLVRAIAAIFRYKNSRLEKACYWPETISFPEPIITARALQKEDIGTHKSLQRLLKEIGLATEVIERFKPDFCFLDGSIIPQHADKPRNNSRIKPLYKDVIKAFEKLYNVAEKNACFLVACVEDSRGARLQEILELSSEERDISYDVILLNYLLKEGQRSFAFPYAKSAREHPVLKDFNKGYANKLYAFYLRASDYDMPLRVEFLSNASDKAELEKEINRIASVTYALSSGHREYSYPAVLLEADMHAKLKQEEINAVMDKIYCKLQSNFNTLLRRNRRPF